MESSQWSVDTIETRGETPLFDGILDMIYKSLYIIIFLDELKYKDYLVFCAFHDFWYLLQEFIATQQRKKHDRSAAIKRCDFT